MGNFEPFRNSYLSYLQGIHLVLKTDLIGCKLIMSELIKMFYAALLINITTGISKHTDELIIFSRRNDNLNLLVD